MQTRPRGIASCRIKWSWAAIVCAVVATSGLGCDGGAEAEQVARSAVTACADVRAGGAWWNQAFAAQTTRFTVELIATPSASSIDAVVGLGDGSVTSFAALAVAVRFNPAGTIDVRSGSIYRADVTRRYQAGVPYWFRLDVDLAAHTYTVQLRESVGTYLPLAQGYAFRTEQAGISRLSVAASKVDSAAGTLEVCGFALSPAPSPGCLDATAGGGFVAIPVPDVTVLGTLDADVFPGATSLDAVIGLSAEPPTRFADLATSVRYAPGGVIDARDGGQYRSEGGSYGTGRSDLRVVADVTSHTYSVFAFAQQLARHYAFRTEQQAVTHLHWLSVIVDGTEGSLRLCVTGAARSDGVVYSREGAAEVVPLASNEALLDDGATVQRLDAAGKTIAQLAATGVLAAAGDGSVLLARVLGTTLTVERYDPALVLRWRATRTVGAGAVIQALASRADGAPSVALRGPGDPSTAVIRFTAAGGFASQIAVPAGLVALDGDQPVVLSGGDDQVQVTRFSATGQVVWQRVFAGRAELSALVVDPLHQVLFGGVLRTEIDFGGGPLPLLGNSEVDFSGFVVKLSPAGDHVFSRNTVMTEVRSVASNGTRAVVSGVELGNWLKPRLRLFDAAGTPTPWPGDTSFHSDIGTGDAVVIGASGRMWWNTTTRKQPGQSATAAYVLALHE
jgi:hypothetical protein